MMAPKIAAFVLAGLLCAGVARAEPAAALSGHVSSAQESAMEGVLVSAHRDGTNITVTVVSDAKGQYAFPTGRLAPGHYTLSIRAVGYDLTAPVTAGTCPWRRSRPDITKSDRSGGATDQRGMDGKPARPARAKTISAKIALVAIRCISLPVLDPHRR